MHSLDSETLLPRVSAQVAAAPGTQYLTPPCRSHVMIIDQHAHAMTLDQHAELGLGDLGAAADAAEPVPGGSGGRGGVDSLQGGEW